MVKIEVIIGSDSPPPAEVRREDVVQPSIAEVEEHAQSLSALLGLSEDGIPCIAATDLSCIASICDRLDHLYYWSIEEGSTFLEEPSLLAQACVPEIIVRCALSRRPRIIAAALRCAPHLLRHRQSRSELRRVAKQYTKIEDGERAVLSLVLSAVVPHAGVVEVVCAAVDTIVEIIATGEEAMIEEVLSSDFIAYVLSALSRHSLYAEVAVASTHFFSELADLQSPQGDFSLATLFCHVGTVLPSLLDTLRHHPHHLVIQENVFQFICMAARHRENIVPLFSHGAYPLIANALLDQLHKPLLFQTSCEAIGYFIAALDQFQRRSLILLLKKILVGRAELEVQLYCVALLCSLSAHFGEGKGSPAVGPYAAYSLYAQPTSVVEETPKEEVRQKTNSPRAVVLKESDTIDFERDDDSRRFVKEACVPQVLMNLMEYYTRAIHALEIDESEEKLVQSLCGVTSTCLALMMS